MTKKLFFLMLSSFVFCLVLFPILSNATTDLTGFIKFTGEAEDDGSGSALSSAGDVNGDGYNDFLIGASSHNGVGANSGAAYLIYGSADTLTGVALSDSSIVKFSAETAQDMVGSSLSSAGDVNNDGYDDFLIGASSRDSSKGSVYLVYGQAEKYTSLSPSDSTVIEFIGETNSDSAGGTVASAGDVNNDGYDDFLISASGDDDNGDEAGAVYLIYGRTTQLSSLVLSDSSIIKFTGAEADDYLASGLSSADLNNDNYSDIIMSSSSADETVGAIYIIYGQASTLSSIAVDDSSVVKFSGEAVGDFAGGSVESGFDVNGDGYYDILLGASSNDAGGVNAGAAYLVYGQASVLTSLTLNDSSVVKFTGEEAGDIAGIDVSLLGDVNNDGYDDFIIGGSMNDVSAADAGAVYFINGQEDALTNLDLSDSSIYKFIGEAASDLAGDVVAASGDVNGDGFAEVMFSAYVHDANNVDDGATYLGYFYIDSDGDGVAGDGGMFSGTDCNDSDDSVSPDALESQDGVDNDCDGEVDETNTGTHPDYENYDPSDTSLHDATVTSVTGDTNGNILVTYTDDTIFQYNIFSITSSKLTKVKQYRNTGYYLVLHPQGKRVALVNIYNGEVLNKKLIGKKIAYKYNAIKVLKLRKKYWSVITSKKKNGQTRLVVIRIKIASEKFGKKVKVKLRNKRIKAGKTKKNKNKLILRNKKSKKIQKYLFTKKYKLKKIK